MSETKTNEAKVEIPVAASFAETRRQEGKLFALLQFGAEVRKVPIRFMSANDRARIDARNADPFPPRKFNAQGAPYLDIYDKAHRKACDDAADRRLRDRIAFLLPDEFMGTASAEEKIKLVFDAWSEANIYSLDRQGANPYETREEGVAAAEVVTAPFAATDGGQ